MKSEKAKDILNDGSCHVSDGILSDGHRVGCSELAYYSSAIEAIEVAEQEAEERVRKRAAKAYCDECCWASGTACEREVAHCAFLRAFTKKLNGE